MNNLDACLDDKLDAFRDECLGYQIEITNIGRDRVAKAIAYGNYLNQKIRPAIQRRQAARGEMDLNRRIDGAMPEDSAKLSFTRGWRCIGKVYRGIHRPVISDKGIRSRPNRDTYSRRGT